jgi:hypothetical protein
MVKILFLVANPRETSRLEVGKEINQIESRIRQADLRDSFELKLHLAARAEEIPGLLLGYRPTIVHFSGHGSRKSEIVLESGSDGAQPVGKLGELFAVTRNDVRCVVLNSCYSEPQAREIAEHIDCVVGMSKAISDTAAISFAATFYEMLGYGCSIGFAFKISCWVLGAKGLGEEDTPQLISHHADPDTVILASLPKAAPPELIIELTRVLTEGVDEERLMAAQGLFENVDKSLTDLIAERSGSDPLPSVRYWLNRALGKIGTPQAIEVLRENLTDPDVYAALGAEDALAELGHAAS